MTGYVRLSNVESPEGSRSYGQTFLSPDRQNDPPTLVASIRSFLGLKKEEPRPVSNYLTLIPLSDDRLKPRRTKLIITISVAVKGKLSVVFYDQPAGHVTIEEQVIPRRAYPQNLTVSLNASNVPEKYHWVVVQQCHLFPRQVVFFLQGQLQAAYMGKRWALPYIDTYFIISCEGGDINYGHPGTAFEQGGNSRPTALREGAAINSTALRDGGGAAAGAG